MLIRSESGDILEVGGRKSPLFISILVFAMLLAALTYRIDLSWMAAILLVPIVLLFLLFARRCVSGSWYPT